jgi:Tol biopolymer transport system component
MGEVYRATDTRLDREVAIKVSAERFSERFEREARVIASLNHPNICTLHDVGPDYLVMELLEGPTLAERIGQGPIPLDEALSIARQIADALEAAHEKGIVHRDLKPGNIKMKADGTVKVLDFGLAKVAGTSTANAEDSPTISMAATQAGVILGTAAYMSPEQARGKPIDKRADIWAFGAVLAEMLTGRPVFRGETVTDILASVVKEEPRWDGVPAKVRRLLRKCLEKDPKRRLRDIGDAWALLEDDAGVHATAPAMQSKLPRAIAAAACALAAAAVVMFWAPWRADPELPKPVRFQIAPAQGMNPSLSFSVSPDGTKLAYFAFGSKGTLRLWVRDMDTVESRALAATEGTGPGVFWSYDSRFIAFEGGGKLKKVDVAGGPPQTICSAPGYVIGGSWNREGVILFGTHAAAIQRVSWAGGVPVPVTAINAARKDTRHSFPVFLPDGRHFLYLAVSETPENTGIYLGSLDSKPDRQDSKRVVATEFGAGFVPFSKGKGGAILFQRDGTLLAQHFDLGRLETVGEAMPVAVQLSNYRSASFGSFAASDNGALVYRGANAANTQFVWFDRQGKRLGSVGTPHDYRQLALSPDGTEVATERNDGGNPDIWLASLSRGTDTRFTFDSANDGYPVWSPDGARIAFSSDRAGNFDLYQHASSGAGQDELLFQSDLNKFGTDWSGDGRFLLYSETDPKTKVDLWVLPMDGTPGGKPGERKPVPFLRTEFNEQNARFSPDGRWVAYESDESGRNEVYVRPFPAAEGGGGKWMVSQGGGVTPHWRGDGKELFYLALDGNIMAVPAAASASAFQPGTPAALFKTPANAVGGDVTADGKRFLLLVSGGEITPAPFTVVLNWMSLLKK